MAVYISNQFYNYFHSVVIILISLYLQHDTLVTSVTDLDIGYQAKNFAPEARRAISRVKTESCRLQLTQFADEQVKQPFHARYLTSINNYIPQELGCLHSPHGTPLDVIEFDHLYDNTSTNEQCLQSCFSRGYYFAGHRRHDMTCHCTNHLDGNKLPPKTSNDSCNQPGETLMYRVGPGRSFSNQHSKAELQNKNDPIRIAFLLSLNGRSILQVRRLLKIIYSKQHLYYIHVDVRQQYLFNKLLPLEASTSNVILEKHRLDTIWGGASLLRMMLGAMSNLSSHHWDYLINLSESDLPLKSIANLEHYLSSQSRSTIYLKAHNMTGDRFIKKQGLDQSFYQCENRMWRLGKRQLPANILYTGGSDWFALPKDFSDHILSEADNSEGLVRSMLDFFNYTLLPAESFFHTIAVNSKFCDRLVDNNLRMTNWKRDQDCGCQHKQVVDWCGCSPRVYRWSELKRLQKTKLSPSIFFARKFDPTVSSSIIGAVEENLINGQDITTLDLDTRYWLNIWEAGDGNLQSRRLSSYTQIGLFALAQVIGNRDQIQILLPESIDLFFNKDRFVGVIFKYCVDSSTSCREILLERNTTAHLYDFNNDCFSDRCQLKVIEVNDVFDTGERIFRNYMPLDATSTLIVYHEWFIDPVRDQNESQKNKVTFEWIGPTDEVLLMQNVKLTAKIEQPHLFLAHKMNGARPSSSGLWHLKLLDKSTKCLDYQFLIFNETSFELRTIEQDQFNVFYRVTQACSSDNMADFDPCNQSDWSSAARDAKLATYDLN